MLFSASAEPARIRDRWLGLAIITLAFGGCLGLSLWAKGETTPEPVRLPAPPTKMEIPGFPGAVRPFEVLGRAAGMTPRTVFRGFKAEGVRPDGTLDFGRKGSSLTLVFQSPAGLGPQPPRAPATLPRRSFCGKQGVRITKAGIALEPDVTDLPCNAAGPKEMPVPEKCSVEQVWALATKRKIKGASASIEYFQSRVGPAYRFSSGKESFTVAAKDCKKILKGRDQAGHVP